VSQQRFFIKTGRGVEGPFSPNQIREFAAKATLKREDWVSEDAKKWVRADKVKGVKFPKKEEVQGRIAARLRKAIPDFDTSRADAIVKLRHLCEQDPEMRRAQIIEASFFREIDDAADFAKSRGEAPDYSLAVDIWELNLKEEAIGRLAEDGGTPRQNDATGTAAAAMSELQGQFETDPRLIVSVSVYVDRRQPDPSMGRAEYISAIYRANNPDLVGWLAAQSHNVDLRYYKTDPGEGFCAELIGVTQKSRQSVVIQSVNVQLLQGTGPKAATIATVLRTPPGGKCMAIFLDGPILPVSGSGRRESLPAQQIGETERPVEAPSSCSPGDLCPRCHSPMRIVYRGTRALERQICIQCHPPKRVCPVCGARLATAKAQQCLNCGARWHAGAFDSIGRQTGAECAHSAVPESVVPERGPAERRTHGFAPSRAKAYIGWTKLVVASLFAILSIVGVVLVSRIYGGEGPRHLSETCRAIGFLVIVFWVLRKLAALGRRSEREERELSVQKEIAEEIAWEAARSTSTGAPPNWDRARGVARARSPGSDASSEPSGALLIVGLLCLILGFLIAAFQSPPPPRAGAPSSDATGDQDRRLTRIADARCNQGFCLRDGRVARSERSDGRGGSRADSAIAFVCRGCRVERLGASPRPCQGVPPGPRDGMPHRRLIARG